ncbi:hypothetical protein ACIN5189_A1039 [Acinetobacter baumannii OIFC189]|nr:hypothetical protein ACIN5189_A1039 [Acinetobacter baumannii OIFC189]
MTHLNELYLILNKYLKWNKSHLKCFALIMLVIILKQTCNLSSASKAFAHQVLTTIILSTYAALLCRSVF